MPALDVEVQMLHSIPASPGEAAPFKELFPRNESVMSDYYLERLFDPENYDHLTIDEQLKLYKTRDLAKTKMFKFATKVFWQPRSRKRVITAVPKEKLRGNPEMNDQTPWTAELRKQVPQPAPPTKEEILEQAAADKRKEFKDWLGKRKDMRGQLDGLGLKEEWLQNKPDRNPIEEKMLKKMIADRQPRIPTPEPEPDKEIVASAGDAQIRRPCPESLLILESYLKQKKLRLLDLFAFADKDKSWTITMEEFRDAIKKAEIPLSGQLLEDLIMSLDSDMNNELDYRELAKGISQFKQEQRQMRRKRAMLERTTGRRRRAASETDNPSDSVLNRPIYDALQKSGTYPEMKPSEITKSGVVSTPEVSSSPTDTHELPAPPVDTTLKERFIMEAEDMVDIRKQTRTALQKKKTKGRQAISHFPGKAKCASPTTDDELKTDFKSGRSMIKIGHVGIDNHCRPSTLTGEVAVAVDAFRQERLREYQAVVKMCKKRNVRLTEKLLEKAMLYPPEKSYGELKKKLRQPGVGLISSTYLMPAKRPPTPEEVKRSKTGKLLVDGRYLYPPYKNIRPVERRVQLSTGKAIIKREVDCWMSFEEYCRLTDKLHVHYKDLHGLKNDDTFWPGKLVDKVRLCLDHPESTENTSTYFYPVKKEKRTNYGYDNDLKTWPVSTEGYVKYGTIEPFKTFKR